MPEDDLVQDTTCSIHVHVWYVWSLLSGHQCQSEHFKKEKNILPLLEFKPQIVQPIA